MLLSDTSAFGLRGAGSPTTRAGCFPGIFRPQWCDREYGPGSSDFHGGENDRIEGNSSVGSMLGAGCGGGIQQSSLWTDSPRIM